MLASTIFWLLNPLQLHSLIWQSRRTVPNNANKHEKRKSSEEQTRKEERLKTAKEKKKKLERETANLFIQ